MVPVWYRFYYGIKGKQTKEYPLGTILFHIDFDIILNRERPFANQFYVGEITTEI